MKEFYIDFDGFLRVEADTKEEARRKFWKWHGIIDSITTDCYDIYLDIVGIYKTERSI